MSEWTGEERRQHFCEGHVKLCEDVSYIKAKIDVIDHRINGSIDDIKNHIGNGSKWRLGIAGTALLLLITIASVLFWAGHSFNMIQDNTNEIEKLRNAKR